MSKAYGEMGVFDRQGRRKYLTAAERRRFLEALQGIEPETRCLCLLLHHTGCRLSEALGLGWEQLDLEEGIAVLRTLKQRRADRFRTVPLPPELLTALQRLGGRRCAGAGLIWPWHRVTAWKRVRQVMGRAGISGPHACPRGMRHGFGVAAISAGVPVTLVQRWLGHAQLETTAIYLAVTGLEERRFAARLWSASGMS